MATETMRINFVVKGAEGCISAVSRLARDIDSGLKSATRTATEFVAGEVKKRIIQPKKLNLQDSSSPRFLSGRKPVRIIVDESRKQGLIEVQSHWTPARGKALLRQTAFASSKDKTTRTGLWFPINTYLRDSNGRFAGRKRSNNSAATSRQAFQFLKFSRHPKLLAWAQRVDKGRQFLKHSVRLTGEVGQALITQPAVERNREKIKEIFRLGVMKGFK